MLDLPKQGAPQPVGYHFSFEGFCEWLSPSTQGEKGGVTAYSIDEGETFHRTVQEAFEHQEQVITAATSDPDTTAEAEKNA